MKITQSLCNKLAPTKINFYGDYDIKNKLTPPKEFKARSTDIVFLQNYLSHIDDNEDSVARFLIWIKNIMNSLKRGAFFVCIDLNYTSTAAVFENMIRADFLADINSRLVSDNIDGKPFKIHYSMVPYGLYKNVFTGEEGLVRKSMTKYYYVVLQRS